MLDEPSVVAIRTDTAPGGKRTILRILLLHLRPTELENKTLVEGMDVIIKELTDKSDIDVHFNHQVGRLPKQMEEHVFRIMQEIINNTLRHAQVSRLDIYLY